LSNLIFSCDIWVCLKKGCVPQVYRNFNGEHDDHSVGLGVSYFWQTHLLTLLGILHLVFVWGTFGDLFGDIVGGSYITFSFCPWRSFVSPTGRWPMSLSAGINGRIHGLNQNAEHFCLSLLVLYVTYTYTYICINIYIYLNK
jgi:hypothetical protein